MTAKIRFIEDMVEGGYMSIDSTLIWEIEYDEYNEYDAVCYDPYIRKIFGSIEKILLDPKAWEAVGKVRGWEEPKECLIDGVESHCSDTYQNKARDFFQYVLDGKNIEEALQAIE